MDIAGWRKQIDELNAQILDLLNRRAQCALEVGKLKQAMGQPIYAPEREMAVLNALRELNAGPLSNEAVQRIFQQIIDEARRLEQEHGESKK